MKRLRIFTTENTEGTEIKLWPKKGGAVDRILHGETLHLRDTVFPFWSATEAGVSTGPGTEAYDVTHQFGDNDCNIEVRESLGLSDEDGQEVIDILEAFFAPS
ncbi:MAG: hypothetical protein GYB20_16715 [Oceanospirillales bacterium]|nr:hypothetical protein [Oceanospirillales bacterium]MBR9889321.1 hypothetical protein [Oceanospirillales bacterium]